MESNRIPDGYEKIGEWYVNLGIPESVRATLKREFASYFGGEIPDGIASSTQLSTVRAVSENPSLLDIIRSCVRDEDLDELDTLITEINNPKTMVTIARLLAMSSAKQTETSKSYAEHRIVGSSYELPPDPFVEINSYFTGNTIDVHERTKDQGTIQKPQILYRDSPTDYFIRQQKTGQPFVKDKAIIYKARITIDCKTREAWIDPME